MSFDPVCSLLGSMWTVEGKTTMYIFVRFLWRRGQTCRYSLLTDHDYSSPDAVQLCSLPMAQQLCAEVSGAVECFSGGASCVRVTGRVLVGESASDGTAWWECQGDRGGDNAKEGTTWWRLVSSDISPFMILNQLPVKSLIVIHADRKWQMSSLIVLPGFS